MFLGVSATLCSVDISSDERAALAALVTSERVRQHGTRSGAYRAAGLNATTWQRIEDGLPVRQDRLVAAVRTLWPESGGDWRRIGVSDDRPLADYEDRAILGEIEARLDERKVAARDTEIPTMAQAGVSPASEILDDLGAAIVAHFRHYTDQANEAITQKDPAAWLARLRGDFERSVGAEIARVRHGGPGRSGETDPGDPSRRVSGGR